MINVPSFYCNKYQVSNNEIPEARSFGSYERDNIYHQKDKNGILVIPFDQYLFQRYSSRRIQNCVNVK